MAVPDFQSLLLPVLQIAGEGDIHISDVAERLVEKFGLTESERAELLPSGRQTRFSNRVHWAKTYLGKAGLIESPKRGYVHITEAGEHLLKTAPKKIDLPFLLANFPAVKAFRQTRHSDDGSTTTADESSAAIEAVSVSGVTPDEAMRNAHGQLDVELSGELLSRIMAAPPSFFERAVVRLMLAMGYGGSAPEAGRALGKAGDGGVDGVIDQDALGLDRIYVQAKRYGEGNTVGPSAIRDFFGALDHFKAAKGLFITTSSFSQAARETAERLSKRIVLIDGLGLAKLMIRYDVGCRVEEILHIKRLDEEFFE